METAVAKSNKFWFTATGCTFSNTGLGYFIESINGTAGDAANLCFWQLSFRPYLAAHILSAQLVSAATILISGL